MMQSNSNGEEQPHPPLHVAIVMDGNGRWAEKRGLSRVAGHRAGAKAAQRIVEAAPGLGVGVLSLFAFSADNWRRPLHEVSALMRLFSSYLRTQTARCVRHGIAVQVIGRRDRLEPVLLEEITATEAATAAGRAMILRVAVDYSARDAVLRAARHLVQHGGDRTDCSFEEFADRVALVDHGRPGVSPVDVFIRTGGEQRLSDFLLWESAYAELFFRPELWPDFRPGDLAQVLGEFRGRDRRFGGLPERPSLTVLRARRIRS